MSTKMNSATEELRTRLQASLDPKWGANAFQPAPKAPVELLASPAGDIPRGAMTEIVGPASSGRTSLLYALLAQVTANGEFCALLDAHDTFDPASAALAGVRLSQVLWVRTGGDVEKALKAADLLAPAGGFGLVAIDLADSPAATSNRIPPAAWFRLRQCVEGTRTALVVLGQQVHARTCSSLRLELSPARPRWSGAPPARLLAGADGTAQRIQNHRAQERHFRLAT